MAKRFLDTGFLDDSWVIEQPMEYKMFYLYLMTNCDHAGIIDFSIKNAEFKTGYKGLANSFETVKEVFGNRLVFVRDNYYFIPKFLKNQYSKGLNPNVKAQLSVINRLKEFSLFNDGKLVNIDDFVRKNQTVSKGLDKGYVTSQDKDKDKYKDTDKDLDKDKDIGKNSNTEKNALDFLENGSIQPQVFFQNNPHPELDSDATEIVQKIITTKNPNSTLEPDDHQISIIKKFLLLNPGQKDLLSKSIEGAKVGDRIKGKIFEVPNLTVNYITNPDNQSRLIGFWDIEQAEKEKEQNLTGGSKERTYAVEKWHG